ncbi:MAG: hypothetical protein LUC45_08675, partial [Paraprevotella sp.]|nr:hypothetical protein [Paraprevotella sp.]
MRKGFIFLCTALMAGAEWVQAQITEGPYYGTFEKNLVIREGFGTNEKGELNLDRNDEYKLKRLADSTYLLQIKLNKDFIVVDKNKAGSTYASDYFYVVQFEGATNGADDCGPRIDPGKLRTFNLDSDTTVTFYARLWQNSDGSMRTQFICDAQRPTIYLSNYNPGDGSQEEYGVYTSLDRPGQDHIGRYVTPVTSKGNGKIEMQFRTVGMDGFEQQADILEDYNVKKMALTNTKDIIGRWQIMYDYPNFKLSYDKMLDYLEAPQLSFNGNPAKDLTDLTIDNADEGINLGGKINTKVIYNQGDIKYDTVHVTLCYQIDGSKPHRISLSRDTDSEDGKTYSWQAQERNILENETLANGQHELKIWFEAEYLGDILKDDNGGKGYTTTFTLQAGNTLANIGTGTNLKLQGDWDESTFATIIGTYDASSITSIDLTEVNGVSDFSVPEGLNPNCLIYVKAEEGLENTPNIIMEETEGQYTCANLTLTDGEPFYVPTTFTAIKASYNRNLSSGEWGTTILPFEVKSDDHITFYSITHIENDQLNVESTAQLKANTPSLFRTTESALEIHVSDIQIEATPSTLSYGQMQGTYTSIYPVAQGSYIISDDSFWNVNTTNVGIHPFRAYISANSANINRLRIVPNGGTTNVEQAKTDNKPVDVYHVNGTQVRSQVDSSKALEGLTSGLYIV